MSDAPSFSADDDATGQGSVRLHRAQAEDLGRHRQRRLYVGLDEDWYERTGRVVRLEVDVVGQCADGGVLFQQDNPLVLVGNA